MLVMVSHPPTVNVSIGYAKLFFVFFRFVLFTVSCKRYFCFTFSWSSNTSWRVSVILLQDRIIRLWQKGWQKKTWSHTKFCWFASWIMDCKNKRKQDCLIYLNLSLLKTVVEALAFSLNVFCIRQVVKLWILIFKSLVWPNQNWTNFFLHSFS